MESYENFPIWMVILSNALSLSIYVIGFYIFLFFGLILAVPYLLYCIWMEASVLRRRCVNCYYYGKVCCFGKGRLCSYFFKKGNVKFNSRKITMRDLLPDFGVFIFPMIGSVILLVMNFSWAILALLLLLTVLTFSGNAFIRGRLACMHCKQRKIGCPAERLFRK
jgi:hypothetical protein